nr:PREDICTED: uncharacterized protein LOC109032242 isoform X1 [Bemisia tabaci]
MAHGGSPSFSNDIMKGQVQLVIASLQKSVPHKIFWLSEDFVDEEILETCIIESISENEETWLQPDFSGNESFEADSVEGWLSKESPKTNFILSNTGNSNNYASGIGKHPSPYLTFVRQKRPNFDMSKLTLAPNILDSNVTGDGVGNVDHENDGSMASSLLLDSHVAHLDKTGVLNFDDQTESESLQNCLNQTSASEANSIGPMKPENQIIINKQPCEPVRKTLTPTIMGRSYTKLPCQQVRYDSPPTVESISDSLEDLNFNPKRTYDKQSEFDSRTYRKSAVKNREKLKMNFEWSGSPFTPLNNGNIPMSTPLVSNKTSNSDQGVFKSPLHFDSSTFSRSQLKNRRAVPFSGLQIKNTAILQSESPGVFETFTIAKQNNGMINIDPEYLENSLDYITNVQTPSFTNFDLDTTHDSPFNVSTNLNSTVIFDNRSVGSVENGHAVPTNGTHHSNTSMGIKNGSVGIVNNSDGNFGSFGINNATMDINNDSYDINNATIDINNGSLGVYNATFDINDCTMGINNATMDINNSSLGINDVNKESLIINNASTGMENAPIDTLNDTFCMNNGIDDSRHINSASQIALNQTYDNNQNIASARYLPPTFSTETLNSTFEVPKEQSYLSKTPNLVKRLSVSQGDGLEKIEPTIENPRRSFSDHKPAVPRGPLKNSKLSLPVKRSLYSSNTNIRQQTEAEEPHLNFSHVYNKTASNSKENLKVNMKSGLKRPMSVFERHSEVKYYNLTDKKNVLNSTFCKSATNLSASYIVEKNNSAEDISRGSADSKSSSSSSILSSSSYVCISTSNGANESHFELKKGTGNLISPPASSSTPKSNVAKRVQPRNISPTSQYSSQEDQLNFQPFPNLPAPKNPSPDSTNFPDINPTGTQLIMNETLTVEPSAKAPPKFSSESTFIRPPRTSGLRMPSVRQPPASRLPMPASTAGIPRFASRLPTFRTRVPAPVKK